MIAFLCHARCRAEGKHASDMNPEQFVRALSLFADRRSCTFIFFPGQAELHFHFSCPPKTAVAPNESQFTTELDGFSVKSLRNTISKLTDPPGHFVLNVFDCRGFVVELVDQDVKKL